MMKAVEFQISFPILSWIVFIPLLGAIVILFIGERRHSILKVWALLVALADFALSLVLYFRWLDVPGMQFEEYILWVGALGIGYHIGVDGLSLFFVLLTTFLMPIAIFASWELIKERVKTYLFFMLLLETGVLGAFLSLDLVLFYIFWEAMLVPMYFLISGWGGERRAHAAFKFFLYTMAGSALMLIAILALAFLHRAEAGAMSFDLLQLQAIVPVSALRDWLFIAFALAFAVKAPLVPLHSWLPDAYGEAPVPVTALLAGVLSKMGIYGFIRFCLPLFPAQVGIFAPTLCGLALIGIIYGSLAALSQKDVKQLIAYSSIAHISLIVLAVFVLNVQALAGGILQVINHGVNIAALFLLAGMLYERRKTMAIREMGGLWKNFPVFGGFLLLGILASVGMPPLNGFVGEFTILVGVFRVKATYAAIAAVGIILSAWYMLHLFRRVMEGPLEVAEEAPGGKRRDLSTREILVLIPLVIAIFFIGLFPNLFFSKMEPAVESLVNQSRSKVILVER